MDVLARVGLPGLLEVLGVGLEHVLERYDGLVERQDLVARYAESVAGVAVRLVTVGLKKNRSLEYFDSNLKKFFLINLSLFLSI